MCCLTLTVSGQTDLESKLFEYINADRAREQLAPLKWNGALYGVALAHSREMAAQSQISHTGSDGSEPHERIEKAGVYATRTAENVARDLNIISAHTSLMESLYHRENILDPEMTDVAVGIVTTGKYLYVTELFIRSLDEVSLVEARRLLLDQMNGYRQSKELPPLQLSKELSANAQSHVDVQENLNMLSPPLLINLMAKKEKGLVRVNVFTATTLTLPEEAHPNLDLNVQRVGIGFKRIRGRLCESGCYLVTLIFVSPSGEGVVE